MNVVTPSPTDEIAPRKEALNLFLENVARIDQTILAVELLEYERLMFRYVSAYDSMKDPRDVVKYFIQHSAGSFAYVLRRHLDVEAARDTIISHIKRAELIPAIRALRVAARNGLGLKEAKDIIETVALAYQQRGTLTNSLPEGVGTNIRHITKLQEQFIIRLTAT